MGKYTTFEELKKDCKIWVEAGKKRGTQDGLKKLLTELYPDKAHFIYELIQNAEDKMATEVFFKLSEDGLLFRHNGKKRDFTLDDIDAITNIGHSTSADDPTAIGQFGVGFKAVYSYTDTPEIHSGQYDFKIIDMLIPEDEGVEKIAKYGETQFIFPFDNPKKPPEIAVKEIQNGLEELTETALLFLTNIKKISYELPDKTQGYISIEVTKDIDFLYKIHKRFSNNNETDSYWCRFSQQCPIYMPQKGLTEFPVSIAYRMLYENEKYEMDSSLQGKVCIFFPSEIDSSLHFHINAPFASTVARDNIRNCEENEKLIASLANLTVESLYFLKDKKLLNYSAYKTMPELRDYYDENARRNYGSLTNKKPYQKNKYAIFADSVYEEFLRSDLFIAEDGNYYNKSEIRKATKEIKTILPMEYNKSLYGKSWIPTIPSVTRVEYFMDQFSIEEYTIEQFIDSLEKDSTFFDTLFADKIENVGYFKVLYALLASSRTRVGYMYDSRQKKTRNEILQNVKFLYCEDKSLHTPNDKIYLKTSYKPYRYLKNPLYLAIELINNEQDKKIKDFLLAFDNIREMNKSEDMLADVSGNTVSIDDYVLKIMEIIEEYKSKKINISDYTDSTIFIIKTDDEFNEQNLKNDKRILLVKASDCCWSKEVAFFFKHKSVLALDKYEIIGDDLSILKEIFEKLGGKIKPEIEFKPFLVGKPFAALNRLNERMSTSVSEDYRLSGIDSDKDLLQIKNNNMAAVSKILWDFVLACNNEKYFIAKYTANKSSSWQYFDSSVVFYLKRVPWVITKSGEYRCPYELSEEDLLDDFKYEKPSLLLAEISKAPHDIADQLKNSGISDDNILAIAQYDPDILAQLRIMGDKLQEQKHKKGKSLSELSDGSDRAQLPEEDEDFYGIPHKSKNLDKRRIKLEKEFDEREQPAIPLKKLQFILEKPSSEEKFFVQQQYSSHCQICKREGILTAKGKRYFEAINIFNTAKLDEKLQINLDSGWNTLCLCPNCAAKFKYSQVTISGLIEQVEAIDVNSIQSAFVDIHIVLEEKPTTIQFTPKHLLALQVAIKKIKQIETENDEE